MIIHGHDPEHLAGIAPDDWPDDVLVEACTLNHPSHTKFSLIPRDVLTPVCELAIDLLWRRQAINVKHDEDGDIWIRRITWRTGGKR